MKMQQDTKENWREYWVDGISCSKIHWRRSSASVMMDTSRLAWPNQSADAADRISRYILMNEPRSQEISFGQEKKIFPGLRVSSRVWKRGFALVRERRELERAAEEEEEKRLQEAEMLLKHQQTPGIRVLGSSWHGFCNH